MIAESPFASDLFDPTYWTNLHGSLSEPDGVYIRIATSGHSLPTKDRGAGVCYTNLVSVADPITEAAAGFQDPGEGIENVVLATGADHNTIISDAMAIATMRSALGTPCVISPDGGAGTGSNDDGGGGDVDEDGDGDTGDDGGPLNAGCSAGSNRASWFPILIALGLVAATSRRRHGTRIGGSRHGCALGSSST